MATKGHSTILEYGDKDDGTSTSWTKLGKITEITPFSAEAEDIDVSHMESEEQWDEVDPGWASAGEISVTVQFDKAKNETLFGMFRVPKDWRITLSDGSTWKAKGHIRAFGNESERKGIVTLKMTIRVSGKPIYTKAADPEA